MNIGLGIGSVSIRPNRIPVGPVRVLTAQQLGAFSVFGQFGGFNWLGFPRSSGTDITLTFLGGA